ncbi:GAF domain-containing protein, partial [Duganella sp. FT3S]
AVEEHDLLDQICRLCVETGGYLMSWVGLAEQDGDKRVRPVAQSGFEDGYLDSIKISWDNSEYGKGPSGTAIRTGKTCVNQDVQVNPRMLAWRDAAIKRGYQSSIAL